MKVRSVIMGLLIALAAAKGSGQNSNTVAVLDSPEAGGMSVGLADLVEAGLQKEGVTTYDRNFVRVWLGERELGRAGILDLATLSQARLPGVNFFVRAEVRPAGTGQFSLSLEAVRAADAVTAIALRADGNYPQAWLTSLERLIREMSVKLQGLQAVGKRVPPGRAITWMPEASQWFFSGMECYARGDYAQAAAAFGRARRWERHFRPAWLWEARSYQQLGFPDQAQRVLEAGHLSDQSIGKAWQHPVLAVVAGNGVSAEEKQIFADGLAAGGKVAVLDPRWIGASAREVDLQLTGEMAARNESGNAWLLLDELVLLERITPHDGAKPSVLARRLEVLSGRVEWETRLPDATNVWDELARLCPTGKKSGRATNGTTENTRAGNAATIVLPLNPAEAELARCLGRAQQNPADVRALLAAADACLAWEAEAPTFNGQQERGAEWRVREEFLKQAVAAIRRNPSQPDASFLLASALWRERYTPEYGIWAGSFSNMPLREQMQPLLDIFPRSAEASNLSETITENAAHSRRSLPTDPSYLKPAYPRETVAASTPEPPAEPPDAQDKRQAFIDLIYQNQWDVLSKLYLQLAESGVRLPYHEEDVFLHHALFQNAGSGDFANQLRQLIQAPGVPHQTRSLATYLLAERDYKNGNFFSATELLRNLVADEDSAQVIVSWSSQGSTSLRDQAYAMLKHLRLFGDGEADFFQCCGPIQMLPPPAPAIQSALEKLFQERVGLASSVGPPNAEKLDRTRKEMRRVEQAMLNQYRDDLPAFLGGKIQASGPGPESLGLCAQLGRKALPLLPQIVAAVGQHDNPSTQCNALSALAGLGPPAAGALPVVILAMEDGDAFMVHNAARRAFQSLGTAPPKAVPYLARLIYHANAEVTANAAEAIFAAAKLPPDFRQGLTPEEFIERVQRWWENTGSWQSWE